MRGRRGVAAARWANGGKGITWFPTDDAAWGRIVDATVTHFGDKVSAYEVWNEPNLTKFAQYGDNSPAARRLRYWQLTRIAYGKVHAKCADCTVLAGASAVGHAASEKINDSESAQWLDRAYANGYGSPFDAVTHHPYPAWNSGRSPSRAECATRWWAMFGPPDEKCGELAAVRTVAVKRGDAGKKIWGPEFGCPAVAAGFPLLPDAAQIRDHLEEGIRNWRVLAPGGGAFRTSFRTPGCRRSRHHRPANPASHGGARTGLRSRRISGPASRTGPPSASARTRYRHAAEWTIIPARKRFYTTSLIGVGELSSTTPEACSERSRELFQNLLTMAVTSPSSQPFSK